MMLLLTVTFIVFATIQAVPVFEQTLENAANLPGASQLQRTCSGVIHYQESMLVPQDMGELSNCIYNRTVTTPETCINECFSCGYCQYAVWLPQEQICSLFKDKKECEKTDKVTTAYSKSQPGQPLLLNCVYCLQDEGQTWIWSGR